MQNRKSLRFFSARRFFFVTDCSVCAAIRIAIETITCDISRQSISNKLHLYSDFDKIDGISLYPTVSPSPARSFQISCQINISRAIFLLAPRIVRCSFAFWANPLYVSIWIEIFFFFSCAFWIFAICGTHAEYMPLFTSLSFDFTCACACMTYTVCVCVWSPCAYESRIVCQVSLSG